MYLEHYIYINSQKWKWDIPYKHKTLILNQQNTDILFQFTRHMDKYIYKVKTDRYWNCISTNTNTKF